MRRPGSIVARSFAATAARPSPHTAPPPPAAILTSRPTPQFQQHHGVAAPQVDGTAFRPGWRVCTRLDALLEQGRIDREQWDAAHHWRRWAETIAPSKVQRWDAGVDTSISATDASAVHRLAAATRLREAAEALGKLRVIILESVLLHDRSWAELARLLHVSDKTACERAVEAITALAGWRAGRSVASPPPVRFRNQPGRL